MLHTKEQQKNLTRDCPLAKVANLIGDSVILLIIRDLLRSPKRYCELEQSLKGISSRTLVKKIAFLEEKKIIKSIKKHDGYPFYTLTQKGERLNCITNAMKTYGEKYL